MDDLGRAEAINSSEARVHDRVPSASRVPPSTPAIPITCPSWVRPAQRRFRSQWGVPSPCGPRRRATHRGAKGGRHSLSAGRGSCFRESRMPTILDVHRLIVRFADIPVIEDLSFTVADGESLAIIGPNGSGKTVLFKALIGAVPHEGTIRWAPGRGWATSRRSSTSSATCRSPAPICSARSGTSAHALARTSVGRSALVNLDAATSRPPIGTLSGGQFQRLLLAFALVGRPSVLLFDEPTAGVDEPGEEMLYERIDRLQAGARPHATAHLARAEPGVPVRHHRAVPGPGRAWLGPPSEVLTPERARGAVRWPDRVPRSP